MKKTRKIIEEILKKYEAYYQTSFTLKWCDRLIYSSFDEQEANSSLSFIVNEKEAVLLCKEKNFEQQLNGMVVALKTIMENEREDDALKNALEGHYTLDEYELLQEQYHLKEVVLLIVQTEQASEYLLPVLKNIVSYAMCKRSENQVVILFENKNFKQALMELKDTLEAELYCRVSLSYSQVFSSLDKIQEAYKQAKEYLDLMMKYDSTLSIADHDKLWLAYFIENIDNQKIETLITKKDLECLMNIDEELLNTIKVFLQNNLKLSETSRQLYLHRNTLIYRLDKIHAITGLDIRSFDDALKMEIALYLRKK